MDTIISDEEEDDDNNDDAVKDQKQKEVIRSFKVSIKKVLSNDLSEEFIKFFFQKMNRTQVMATNFHQDLAAATTATALLIIKIAPNSSRTCDDTTMPSSEMGGHFEEPIPRLAIL
ncbi:unnamed protein product [Umbelopsis ramanniana]